MHPRVTGVRVVSGFTIELEFADGLRATLDMEPWVGRRSGMLEPLQDTAYFARVTVKDGTLVWPNDADLDPDVLYEVAHGWIPVPVPGTEIHLSSDRIPR